MRSIRTAFVAAAVLGAFSTAWAGDPPPVKNPWEGFGVGSTVTEKTTASAPMPGMEPQTTETRKTLTQITDEAYVVKHETKVGDQWMPQDIPFPRKMTGKEDPNAPKPKVEDLGSEKVSVEGTDYDCKKQKTILPGSTSLTWTHEKHGILKMEGTTEGAGSTSMVVTKLATKATVAGKEIECRETKIATKMPQGETEILMLESDAVPGRGVRMEMAMKMGPMSTKSVTEVTSFEKK